MCSGGSILFGIIITIDSLFHKQAEPWEAAAAARKSKQHTPREEQHD